MVQLKIDPEFQSKIPPLLDSEFKQLEENILKDGKIFEPIAVWNGVIVDGHNRYKIAQAHPEIPYGIMEMQFADKWEAFDWMYKKQLGRRNLNEMQVTYLTGKLLEARKHVRGSEKGGYGNQYTKLVKVQNEPSPPCDTAEQIAREVKKGRSTVKRAEHFAKGIDAIREQEPELAEDILTSKKKVSKEFIQTLAKAKTEDMPSMIQELKKDKPKVIKTKEEREKEKQEREEDRKLAKRLSENVNRMRCEGRVEATVDDLISMIQDVANASFASLKSIIGSHRDIVDCNKKVVSESIIKIFNSTIDKMKEIV